jgi:hypothetical protein
MIIQTHTEGIIKSDHQILEIKHTSPASRERTTHSNQYRTMNSKETSLIRYASIETQKHMGSKLFFNINQHACMHTSCIRA